MIIFILLQPQSKPALQATDKDKPDTGPVKSAETPAKQQEPKKFQSSAKDDYLGLGEEVDPTKLLRY